MNTIASHLLPAKALPWFLTPLLVLLCLAGTLKAEFTYTSTATSVTITGYSGVGGDVIIPGIINGLPVTTIGNYAFYNNPTLVRVTIPDSVTSIGESAFYYCTGLTSVTIGNGVYSINIGAFASCTSLTSVTIPNSVASIGSWAFNGCTGLMNVTIGGGVYIIDESAFAQCRLLKGVVIPESVIYIGNAAFHGCEDLNNVIFEGNAPDLLGSSVFASTSPGLILYCYEGNTGFSAPAWWGYTVVMLPAPGSGGFFSWPVLDGLPSDRRGPLDRNGPLDLPNLLAYAMALNPLEAVPGDLPSLTAPHSSGDRVSFRYRRAKNAPGILLTPMTSFSPGGGWNPAEVLGSEVIHDGGGWEVIEIEVPAPPGGKLFFLLKAEEEP